MAARGILDLRNVDDIVHEGSRFLSYRVAQLRTMYMLASFSNAVWCRQCTPVGCGGAMKKGRGFSRGLRVVRDGCVEHPRCWGWVLGFVEICRRKVVGLRRYG